METIPTSVYKYYDEYDVLLYVGITSRGITRNKEHNTTKEWWKHVGRQEVEHFPSRKEALARETHLIWAHKPPFNIQQNPHHEAMRNAYENFRSSVVTLGGHSGLLTDIGREIPLVAIEEHEAPNGARVVSLATEPRHAPVAMALEYDGTIRALHGTTKVGQLREVRRVGPMAVFDVTLRRGVEVFEPFVRLKVVPGKPPVITVRNIQVGEGPAPLKPSAERQRVYLEQHAEAAK